jgi:DNA-binding GntR family transcriptional regulator
MQMTEQAKAGSLTAGDAPAWEEDAPLSEQIAGHIRDMIVMDEFQPGQRLRERNIAEQLNISRTPVREAFKMLASEGLVQLLPNRGAVVASISPEEVHDKLQVLTALEALAGELACEKATDEEIAEIKALHYEMLAAFTRKDRKSYFKVNQQIHHLIVLSSHNSTLVETHARINMQLYRVRYASNLKNRTWPSAIEEHEHILQALEARDGMELVSQLKAHFNSTWSKFQEFGEQEAPESDPEAGN